MNQTDEPQFGIEDCTCVPFTRQTDPPRYLNRPTDTVDMISGWEIGRDCPHHKAAVQPLTDRVAWVDGDPLMEAIAAAAWEGCRTEGTSLVVDDPRNIAAAVAGAARGIALRQAADFFRGLSLTGTAITAGEAETELRRMADEAQPAAEAHPAEHTWAAELYDPATDEWAPTYTSHVRDRAVNALEHGRRIGPTWKDGTTTQRRLVRATTTYTVEAAPVAPQPAAADTSEEPRRG